MKRRRETVNRAPRPSCLNSIRTLITFFSARKLSRYEERTVGPDKIHTAQRSRQRWSKCSAHHRTRWDCLQTLQTAHYVWSASIGSSPPRSRHEVVDWTGVRHHRGSSLQRSARSALSPELCALRPCPTPLLRDRLHPVNPSDEHRDVVHGAEPAKRAGRVGKAWVSGWRGAGGRCTRTSTSRAWSARSASSARSAQRLARAARKEGQEGAGSCGALTRVHA